ncbi:MULTISPECIES: SRPBCC family protein [unclassified Thioalkalivibrio]|uniref:SRPBCC family protein n=1 Tax=unclassified Thioalkalivibrio TaxID=2621013 RepID=UPI00036BEEC2|nr:MULTISPECIES: SRPBCC family protein [unclassified Thioalkalivibrio]
MAEVVHVTVYIARSSADVYAFASDPGNLPLWAEGLARSEVRKEGDAWLLDGPLGTVRVRFALPNDLGVMDHDVELPSGEVVRNPMRVLPNGEGSEFVFSLFRQPGMSAEQFASDRDALEKDLDTLKRLLEGTSRPPTWNVTSG